MNFNAHFGKESLSLGLVRIEEAANATSLSRILLKKLDEYGINATFLITDGASVMKKMSKDTKLFQIMCMLHGINLAIGDVSIRNLNMHMGT